MTLRTAEQLDAELAIATELERAWQCEVHPFGPYFPLDYYAVRRNRFVAVIEAKDRSHASTDYPTVYLSVRKWLSLTHASMGFAVPALFVVRFIDGLRWVDVLRVDSSRHAVGGRRDRGYKLDVEPVILVPVDCMRRLDAP